MTPQETLRYLKSALVMPKINKLDLAGKILSQYSYEDLMWIFNQVPALHRSLFKLPYLKRKSYQDIGTTGNFIFHKSLTSYMGFILYIAHIYKQEIQDYLKNRELYEECLLLSQYEKARDCLKKINCSLGYSMWSLEQEMKIARIEGDITKCSELHNLVSNCKTILPVFSRYYWESSSIDFSFDKDIEAFKQLLQDSKARNSDVVNFVASSTIAYDFDFEGENWIMAFSKMSLVDLYNGIRDNLWRISRDIINESDFRKYVSSIAEILQDSVFLKFVHYHYFIEYEMDQVRESIICHFYEARFDEVVKASETYLQEHVTDFEILDYYVRSLILLHKHIENLKDNATVVEQVCYHYYNFLSHESTYRVSYKKLCTMCKSLYSIYSFRFLYSVIQRYENGNLTSIYSNCYSYVPYPSLYDVGEMNAPDSSYYLKHDKSVNKIWNVVHNNKSCVESCIICNDNNPNIAHMLYSKFKIPPYYEFIVLNAIFKLKIKQKEWNSAVSFYVEQRLANPLLEINFDRNLLIKYFVDDRLDNIQNPLDMSIFYTMIDAPIITKYLAYKHFLKSINVNRASEIEDIEDSKIIYFLKNVARLDILSLHSTQFKTYDQVIDERVSICNKIYKAIQDKQVGDEVTDLIKKREIKNLIVTIDESKIFVDEEGLLRTEFEEEKNLFNLYKSIDKSVIISESASNEYQKILDRMLPNNTAVVLNVDSSSISYKCSLFKQLYISVRDKFLLNPKYGLDFYLSTRIRHGTLINQLRKHFEESQLVTNMESKGESYSLNTYWVSQILCLEGDSKEKAYKILADFSQIVDNIILSIKDDLIQIKFETHQSKTQAVFDYTFSETTERLLTAIVDMYAHFDFDQTIDVIFEILWLKTETNLENLKSLLSSKKQELCNCLSHLNDQLYPIVKDNLSGRKILDAITKCNTDLQQDFVVIEGWLQRRNVKNFNFSFQNVYDTCDSITKSMNNKMIQLKLVNNSTSLFDGKYFNSMYDILHELIINALNYQNKCSRNLKCSLNVEEKDNFLKLTMSNELIEKDVTLIREIVNKFESSIVSGANEQKVCQETHTGMYKLYNLIMHTLANNNNKNNYHNTIEDNQFITTICLELSKIKSYENIIN